MGRVAAILCLAGMLAGPVSGEPEPPATRPAAVASSIPERFNVLLSRSIFARDGIATPLGGTTGPASQPATTSNLVLRGVILEDGTYTAVFEDPATHQLQRIKEDGAVGGGKITHLNLRGFKLDGGDQPVQVAVGQDLKGQVVAPPPPPPNMALANAGPGQPTTAPAGNGPGEGAGPMQAGAKIMATPEGAVVAEGAGPPAARPAAGN